MDKRKIIIANWKMNMDIDESRSLAREIGQLFTASRHSANLDVFICPSFEAITAVREALASSNIGVGAQDVFWMEKGSYTGEISASMLKSAGASIIIVGHSERRKYVYEDNMMVNKKLKAVLDHELVPIFCIGETFEERAAGHTDIVLMRQITDGLNNISLKPQNQLVIAYEPIWAIGTGQAIEPSMAELATHTIRQSLLDLYTAHVINEQIRIIYGGSVDEDNVADFFHLPTIEGTLVGSASLNANKFIRLLERL